MKKWSRNQCSFINAHNYNTLLKLFFTSHERKILNAVFSNLTFWNFDLRNTIPRSRIELLRQFFFSEHSSFFPLCDALKILKSCFPSLCMVSQIASQILLKTLLFYNFRCIFSTVPVFLIDIFYQFFCKFPNFIIIFFIYLESR